MSLARFWCCILLYGFPQTNIQLVVKLWVGALKGTQTMASFLLVSLSKKGVPPEKRMSLAAGLYTSFPSSSVRFPPNLQGVPSNPRRLVLVDEQTAGVGPGHEGGHQRHGLRQVVQVHPLVPYEPQPTQPTQPTRRARRAGAQATNGFGALRYPPTQGEGAGGVFV